MTHDFDKEYWDQRWQDPGHRESSMRTNPPNPHLVAETGSLTPGSALEAGCGAGAEAIWLAEQGWQVTAVDVAAEALAKASRRAAEHDVDGIRWVEADLSTWTPEGTFDLVTTHYAHPSIPQLDFYQRLAEWVAPGGTLLLVGHLHRTGHDGDGHDHAHEHGHGHGGDHHAHDNHPPAAASVRADDAATRLDPQEWDVVTAAESRRTVTGPGGKDTTLHDVVVRAVRR
ncbi:class I SAM-dependent methyltransferase [Janibacter cremeus]|uniref:SAM-dependent methyltransferase n=1 Tax=Janibacter cremeus TaxID=1285192 RepID=A0A852VMS6_9MICO|nr:class I SAM-dependent methyltransferase [Janibacter cremeus]NYF98322.1 SAM-dependent methyltransferase [Janibacter cremeus]